MHKCPAGNCIGIELLVSFDILCSPSTSFMTSSLQNNVMSREIALEEAGFHDIYKSIKQEENEKALKLLPAVLAELDAEKSDHSRWELIWRGVCAANIFDLGAAHTTEMYHKVCMHVCIFS